MDREKIKKVHVVFKTHLDIGFTDLGKNVLEKYRTSHIPHSIDLAFELNTETEKKFIWTVGSCLIYDYLKNADEEGRKKLERAIRRGDICWHGLACTTHTELLDEDLFSFDLEVSDRLDRQFGKKTIAAKMTDVPGHTRAIVPFLAEHGKSYLHIGVNASSMVPETPAAFRWKSGGSEVIVQYSADYGAPCYVEGMDEVLEFAHTGDNLGPQSAEAVEAEMSRIGALYPNAEIVASTLDAYAESLLEFKDKLPVVEEEIGDTWIHGVATDPLKVMQYRALVQLKNRWKQEGRLGREQAGYEEFMMNLLLVAEHTWGMDFKKYLADFTNWEKADFQAAREADRTTMDFLTNRNAHMRAALESDIRHYCGGEFKGSYSLFESSHEEQREYINKAIEALPKELAGEAAQELERLERLAHGTEDGKDALHKKSKKAQGPAGSGAVLAAPYQHLHMGAYEAAFDGSGAIVYLSKDGKRWITDGCFGRLGYAVYNAVDCINNYYLYNRNFRETQCWSEADFSKPGLEFAEAAEHREYSFGAALIEQQGSQVRIYLEGDVRAAESYGSPRHACICYDFSDEIRCSVSWQGKDANKMPEALWFDFNFDVENVYRWKMKKLGQRISPLDVVKAGNRRQHCVEGMYYDGADGRIEIRNLHAPLISIGGRFLYGDYRRLPELADGFSYCLFNNKWGTNFKMWCGDDAAFEFVICLENK